MVLLTVISLIYLLRFLRVAMFALICGLSSGQSVACTTGEDGGSIPSVRSKAAPVVGRNDCAQLPLPR